MSRKRTTSSNTGTTNAGKNKNKKKKQGVLLRDEEHNLFFYVTKTKTAVTQSENRLLAIDRAKKNIKKSKYKNKSTGSKLKRLWRSFYRNCFSSFRK